MIYLSVDSPKDATSLSSTCKHAREIYNDDYRIGMHMWPGAFEILDLQRPGVVPAWKEEQLVLIHRRFWTSSYNYPKQQYRFLDLDKGKGIGLTAKLLCKPRNSKRTFNTVEDRKRLIINHGFITALVDKLPQLDIRGSKTRSRIACNSSWLGREGHLFALNSEAKGVSCYPSEMERHRFIGGIYTAAELQLRIYGFAGLSREDKNKEFVLTNTILDYAPVFKLGLRESLELAALMRLFFLDLPDLCWDERYVLSNDS